MARNNVAMGRTFERVNDRLAAWLLTQPVFFVATAPLSGDGLVNCSPKGNRQELLVMGPRTVAFLDQTGSGVETIAHLKENGRIVVLFCAFAGPPRIVRLHGTGRVVLRDSLEFDSLVGRFPRGSGVGVRSVIVVEIERISDSCGNGVPLMNIEQRTWTSGRSAKARKEYATTGLRRTEEVSMILRVSRSRSHAVRARDVNLGLMASVASRVGP
jgi:hypothetical protein